MNYKDFTINQIGTQLTTSATIKLVKYENKVSRIFFTLDGSIDTSQLHLIVALSNPKTKKTIYSPLLREDDSYYFIVGTEITMYVGRWTLLLLGVSPTMEIIDTHEIQDDLIVYSSAEFKKIVVMDTFLDDDNTILVHPTIEKTILDLETMHDNVTALAVQTGEDATECSQILTQCQDILAEINQIYSHMLLLESSLVSEYESRIANLQSTFNQYLAELRAEREGGG